MTQTSDSPGAVTLAAFLGAVLIGGGNFLAVRFSNAELPPFWGAGSRFMLAAVIFVIIALIAGLEWPRGRTLVMTALYGVVTFTLSYALMYWALVVVTAGMAAVVLAIVPLATPFLAAAHGLERVNRRAVLGAVGALVGILWMTIGPGGLVLPLGGLIAILVAALTVSEGVVLSKEVAANHPVMTNAVGMGIGAPLLLGVSAVFGEAWVVPGDPRTLWSVSYLVVVGSVGLFVLSLIVVKKWTASAMAYAFVLFPVVTMLLEAVLADVPLTMRRMTGAAIVMASVWFGALSPSSRHRPAPTGPEEPVPAST